MTDTTTHPTMTATDSWLRFARNVAIVMVIWAALVHVVARVLIPPVLIIGLVFLAFVPFLARGRRWVGLGFAAFALLAVLGNIPGLVDELSNPESAPAFVLTLLSTIGAVLAIVSGTASFFGWTPQPERALVIGGVAVFVVGAVVSIAMFATTESDVAGDTDVRVLAEKVLWEPEDVVVTSGASGVWIDNKDGIRHTFTVEELGVDLEIPALKAKRLDIDAAPGTYEIICTVPGHEAMTGTLIVEG